MPFVEWVSMSTNYELQWFLYKMKKLILPVIAAHLIHIIPRFVMVEVFPLHSGVKAVSSRMIFGFSWYQGIVLYLCLTEFYEKNRVRCLSKVASFWKFLCESEPLFAGKTRVLTILEDNSYIFVLEANCNSSVVVAMIKLLTKFRIIIHLKFQVFILIWLNNNWSEFYMIVMMQYINKDLIWA